MKSLLMAVAGLGAIAFVLSVAIRVLNLGTLLKSTATGWWRASIGICAVGILFALIQLISEHSKARG